MSLSQVQVDYIVATTNTRGAGFAVPYGYLSSAIVGIKQDYLNIVVHVLSTGAVHGGSVKDTNGDLSQPGVTVGFAELVGSVLTAVERHLE